MIFSEDQGTFVEASTLEIGEQVRTLDGAARLVRAFRGYNLEVWADHVSRVTAAGVLVHNSCAITSRIKEDTRLLKAAEHTGRSHQVSIDRLTKQLSRGNLNPGIGTKSIGFGISEARARDGARVYFKVVGERVEILWKSNKGNQSEVISVVLEVFG